MVSQTLQTKDRKICLASSSEGERMTYTLVRDGEILSRHVRFVPPSCQEIILRSILRRADEFYGKGVARG